MTREIKFRAWTGLEMEYKIMTGFLGAFFVKGIDPQDSASMSPFNTIYSEQTPVMQFTGLLDKNGKEIYEGDLCRYEFLEGEETVQEVVYHGACFSLHGLPLNQISRAPKMEIGHISVEVIGNIYENPELLKV